MKKELDRIPNIPEVQKEILNFWKENKTFDKSLCKENNKEIVFYDGPPFPTGKPHHGTVLVSFIKVVKDVLVLSIKVSILLEEYVVVVELILSCITESGASFHKYSIAETVDHE